MTGAGSRLRLFREIEKGLLAGLEWMPYPSDVADDLQSRLNQSILCVSEALVDVRAARQEVEREILDTAVSDV